MVYISELPPPEVWGFNPDRFPDWRPGQDTALLRVVESKKRISVGCLPTGFGKSLLGMGASKLLEGRVVFLTRRKGLQSQLSRDFDDPPVHDVRGQSSYVCIHSPSVTVDVGPCHAGYQCQYRKHGCLYYDAVAEAKHQDTPAVVTNYSFWFTQAKRNPPAAVEKVWKKRTERDDELDLDDLELEEPEAQPMSPGTVLGDIALLICDEAHGILDELSNFLTVELVRADIERLGIVWPAQLGSDMEGWKLWTERTASPKVKGLLDAAKRKRKSQSTPASPPEVREIRRLDALYEKLQDLVNAEGRWSCQLSDRAGTLRACPVWPGEYLERYLFQGAKKVLMMSATIRPKTLELLGLKEADYDFFETQSSFPVERRIVYSVDAPRLSFRSTPGELGMWMDRIDYILSKRLDRRVIIHVGSYDRKNFIMTTSKYRAHMIGHDRGDVDAAIARFKSMDPPAILVSQSITEGFDFPYADCEAQIIAKWPFPDTRDDLVVARQKDDPDYGAYVSMQTVVQATGRAMRAADDRTETFIVDGQAKWTLWKYKEYAPEWWNLSVRKVGRAPDPPPSMASGAGRQPQPAVRFTPSPRAG